MPQEKTRYRRDSAEVPTGAPRRRCSSIFHSLHPRSMADDKSSENTRCCFEPPTRGSTELNPLPANYTWHRYPNYNGKDHPVHCIGRSDKKKPYHSLPSRLSYDPGPGIDLYTIHCTNRCCNNIHTLP